MSVVFRCASQGKGGPCLSVLARDSGSGTKAQTRGGLPAGFEVLMEPAYDEASSWGQRNNMSTLSPHEISRYKRHLVLRDVGGQGQQALKAARVLVVGAGGLGSPLALYLAAAGVGTLGLVDDDRVSLDNLQRQIVHDTDAVGTPKVASARVSVHRVNPNVEVETHELRLTADNARALIDRYDIVVDGSDNFATRYLVSDTAYHAKKTLVFGAVGPFEGYVSTFKPHLRAPDGTPYPTYRCLFPESPQQRDVANCAEVGVLGSVVGVIGTLQATEVLKEILGIGRSLAGRLLIWDALEQRFDEVRVAWDEANALNGRGASTLLKVDDLAGHGLR